MGEHERKPLSERMFARAERMKERGDRSYAMFLRQDAEEVADLESQIEAMRDFMALLYLGIREGRDEAFEALDEKTKRLINEVWFEMLEEDSEDETIE